MIHDYSEEHTELGGAQRLLKRAVTAVAVLSFLTLFFYALDGVLYAPVENAVWELFGEDENIYNAVLDVYDMFSYALGFFLPLGITLFFFRGDFFRPEIPFSPKLPEHPFAAIFAVIGVLYIFGDISDTVLGFLDSLGVPILWYAPAIPETPGRIVLYFLSSVILPAITEELVFRGYILHVLLPYGKTFAILVSAVLFGVMHLYLPQLLYASAAGVLIGYFVVRGGSLWIGILIHLFNNLLSFLSDMAYVFLSEDGYTLFSVVLQGGIYIACLVSVLILFGAASAEGQSARQFESGSVYNRLMTTADAFRGFLNIPLLLYLAAAAYFILVNSIDFSAWGA